MELFLKPFYSYEDTDAPADSIKDWQCAVLSFAAHVFLVVFAVFCMPLFALHPNDLPKEEIIMVTMESLPLGCGAMASAVGAGSPSMNAAAAPPAAPPAPPPETKADEKPKPIKRTVATAKPEPVNISPPKPETATVNHPEPESPPDSMTQAAIASETSPNDTGAATSDAATSGTVGGSSEKSNHSGGGTPHGRGSGTGTGSGMGSGSGESIFGSVGGPRFIHRELPRFPRMARFQGKEGTVVLRLSLDHAGRLLHVEVVSGAGQGFDDEAIHAIQKSTFSPAVRNGRPVDCLALLAVQFQLE
jgi:protein TonB